MTESIFREYVAKYLRNTAAKIYELINNRPADAQIPLLYKGMLVSEHTSKDTWDSINISRSVVAADVVAMDSQLPLKSRGSFSKASGKIPKLGMKRIKKESDIKDIQVAMATGGSEAETVGKLMNDVDSAIKGMEYAKEIMFLQALSTGMTLVKDEDSDGKGIRIDFGYLDSNTYTVGKKWSEAGATPISDLQVALDGAEAIGVKPSLMILSKKAFRRIRTSVEGKQLAASYKDMVITDLANLPTPSNSLLLEAIKDEFSVDVLVVDSVIPIEKPDGTQSNIRPWEEANVVFVPSNIVGRLVYGDCVEASHPNKAVEYANGDHGTLLSVYHNVDPFAEVTAVQAHAIPVIDGGHQIILVETETVTAGSKKETKAKKERA